MPAIYYDNGGASKGDRARSVWIGLGFVGGWVGVEQGGDDDDGRRRSGGLSLGLSLGRVGGVYNKCKSYILNGWCQKINKFTSHISQVHGLGSGVGGAGTRGEARGSGGGGETGRETESGRGSITEGT